MISLNRSPGIRHATSSTKTVRHGVTVALLSAALTLTACGTPAVSDAPGDTSADSESLVFAVIPSENATTIGEDYGLVVDVLEQELQREIEVHYVTSYAALIEAQDAGQVDIGVHGPFSYVSAVDSGVELTAIAAAAAGAEDNATYQSHGIVSADSDISDLADLAGREVCFVDQTSTSGYLYPSAGLLGVGVDPETHLNPAFVGGHDAVAISVADGTCAGGFIHDALLDRLVSDGTLAEGDIEVIWRSEEIPPTPVVAHDQLGAELTAKIQEVFITKINQDVLVADGYCTGPADCRLPQEAWGYLPVEDTTYDGIRRVCTITGIAACTS